MELQVRREASGNVLQRRPHLAAQAVIRLDEIRQSELVLARRERGKELREVRRRLADGRPLAIDQQGTVRRPRAPSP